MFGLGTGEILLILVIALIVLGPSKLPELAKSLGKGMREFRRAATDFQRQINDDSDPNDQRAQGPSTPPRPNLEKAAQAPDEAQAPNGAAPAAEPVRPGPPVEVERMRPAAANLPRGQPPAGAGPRGTTAEAGADLAETSATEPERG